MIKTQSYMNSISFSSSNHPSDQENQLFTTQEYHNLCQSQKSILYQCSPTPQSSQNQLIDIKKFINYNSNHTPSDEIQNTPNANQNPKNMMMAFKLDNQTPNPFKCPSLVPTADSLNPSNNILDDILTQCNEGQSNNQSQHQINQNNQIKSNLQNKSKLKLNKNENKKTQTIKRQSFGPNFAFIPLCCRTYFFDLQRILPAEDKRIQYKSYKIPFNPPSIETLKKTICAFINTIGGQIYIGIKQTTNKKYRYVLGNYLTQNDKQEVIKSFRKIAQNIYPNCIQNLEIQFIPIRKTPFPDLDLLQNAQQYYYDFSKKYFDVHKYPYLPARYVIRIRVRAGMKDFIYSYRQTEYQLNKNTTATQFIPFRSQNQVLVKQISQQVLKIYKQRLLYEKEKYTLPHDGPCFKPQIGNPKNQYQQNQNPIDAKKIQAVLYEAERKRFQNIEKTKASSYQSTNINDLNQLNYKLKEQKSESQENKKQKIKQLVTQQELKMIFKHPLKFIVINLSQQKLKKCIDKTPAKDYSKIQKLRNVLNGSQILVISIDGYHRMEQFLRVITKIQAHYKRQDINVQFVGISKSIKVENMDAKFLVQSLMNQHHGHKCVVRKKIFQFYNLSVAASYLLYMRELGYNMQIVPE